MPPVRWKLTAVAVLYLIHIAAATRQAKDLLDDGWKPIIGHTSGPGVVNYHQTKKNDEANINFRDPVDIKKIQVVTSPKPISTKSIKQHGHSHLNKVPPINKQSTYPTGHGYSSNQQPMNFITHRSQTKLYKVPVMGKNHMPIGANGKRIVKPIRGQNSAYNQKDEILAQSPSTGLGNYAFFNPTLGSVKPRHPQPQQTNIDYYNQFAPQNNDLYRFQRLPIQQYVLPKNQLQNEVHYTFQAQNDEYTRNLVPPPPRSQQYNIEKERIKEKPVAFKEVEQTKSTTEQIKTIKQRPENQILTDTVLYQIPPPFQQPTYYVPSQQQVGFDIKVTKENIREFHNNNNPYQQENIYNSDFGNYKITKKPTETPNVPTYEVTEEKEWQEFPPTYEHQFQPMKNVNKNKRPLVKQQAESFLPTPVSPSRGVIPTSPTQSEISTIFTELSQKINRQKENLDPNFFIVKEVSTHYPILSNPNVGQFNWQYSIPAQDTATDLPNEITTVSAPKSRYRIQETETPSEIQTTTPISTTTVRDLPQRRRPGHRRRRPGSRNKFTTEEPVTTSNYYDLQKEIQQTTVKQRRRRPTQAPRTTEAPSFIETTTQRIRHRIRTRPTVASIEEEIPQNHKMISEEISKPIRGSYVYKSGRRRPTKYYSTTANEDITDEEDYSPSESYRIPDVTKEKENSKYYQQETESPEIHYEADTNEESSEEMFEDYKKETSSNQPAEDITTIIPTPHNFEYITKPSTEEIERGRITIKEIYTTDEMPDEETTLATTTASTTTTSTTTTTEEPTTTTKINRFRRPIHYKPPRPKFSVKDYHQRLNQYISSTEASKVNTESMRTRLHYRTRRPTLKQEEHAEEKTESTRKKFVPKSQRQPITSENNEETTEGVKTVNARLRPFGRYRSTTTEPTSTQKVSIKPGIFSTLRRPPPLSLKERIQNKNRLNFNEKVEPSATEDEKQTDIDITENTQIPTTTEIPITIKLSTTPTSTTTTESNIDEVEEDESQEIGSVEIIKNDPLLQSQRVSDLTSSTQNQYNTPGMFKNVSPNVRRIPNYFTLATDDPILPIEAFFPNINKDRHS